MYPLDAGHRALFLAEAHRMMSLNNLTCILMGQFGERWIMEGRIYFQSQPFTDQIQRGINGDVHNESDGSAYGSQMHIWFGNELDPRFDDAIVETFRHETAHLIGDGETDALADAAACS